MWSHEVGHLVGLVNNGTAMVNSHIDAQHGHHCANKNCLMYWEAETPSLVDLVKARVLYGDQSPLFLDSDCQADLAAVR